MIGGAVGNGTGYTHVAIALLEDTVRRKMRFRRTKKMAVAKSDSNRAELGIGGQVKGDGISQMYADTWRRRLEGAGTVRECDVVIIGHLFILS